MQYINQEELIFMQNTVDEYFEFINLKENDTVIDVGANIGVFSKRCRELNAGKIFAFEPVKPIYNICKHNIGSFATIENVGLSRVKGKKSYRYYGNNTMFSTSYPFDNIDMFMHSFCKQKSEIINDDYYFTKFKDYESNVTTLDNIIDKYQLETIDILKIDVVKAELDIIESIESWDKIKNLIIKVYSDDNKDKIMKLLCQNGFEIRENRASIFKKPIKYFQKPCIISAKRPRISGRFTILDWKD